MNDQQINFTYEENDAFDTVISPGRTYICHMSTPDDILNMSEHQYDDLIEGRSLDKIIPYLTMDGHISDKQYDWLKSVRKWSSNKAYANINENSIVNHECISTIIDHLSSKMFDSTAIAEDDEIFEEIIVSKKIGDYVLTRYVLEMVQSYPTDKFEHYMNLILEHYDLQKAFNDFNQGLPLYTYSLATLNIIANGGVKIQFDELLTQCCRGHKEENSCRAHKEENNLIDKIYYAIDNLDINNLSIHTLATIYNSDWLEIIISKTNSGINFDPLDPVYIIGNINRNKMGILTKWGYDFQEMINNSIRNHAKDKYLIDNEKTDRSKYLIELLEDIDFDKATLKHILRATIDNLHLVMDRYH